METLKKIALTLVIIGAINWGLIGLFQFDLVAAIFGGQDAALARVIYTLVGLSGLYCITMLFDPMTETNKDMDRGKDRTMHTRNVNYGTEFGEENDVTNSSESFADRERDQDPLNRK
ncbi:DUF378 domain-containing protein [Virgibacillus necropolis]|uniref:DUF378 domain-containing protein n=1 Tax=Virgibacillus necropolis TaxID=163877 RepID=A0A221MFR5_9BACI|nr:DUF378 domain-containing protein [Virgibacillus necropolis]ASN06471.1 DUF378 domain-containing protein [Virgibacillus necropolis]